MGLISDFLATFGAAWRGEDTARAGVRVSIDAPDARVPTPRLDAAAGLLASAFFDDWDRLNDDERDVYRDQAAPWLAAIDGVDAIRDRARLEAIVMRWWLRSPSQPAELVDDLIAAGGNSEPFVIPSASVAFGNAMYRIADGPRQRISKPAGVAECASGHRWNDQTGLICPVCGCPATHATTGFRDGGIYVGLRRRDLELEPMVRRVSLADGQIEQVEAIGRRG